MVLIKVVVVTSRAAVLSAGGATLPPKNRLASSGAVSRLPAFLWRHNGHNGLNRHTRRDRNRQVDSGVSIGHSRGAQRQLEGSFKPSQGYRGPVLMSCISCTNSRLQGFELFPLSDLKSPRSIMREIVHVQAGQCGNQIGAKFWEIIRLEKLTGYSRCIISFKMHPRQNSHASLFSTTMILNIPGCISRTIVVYTR